MRRIVKGPEPDAFTYWKSLKNDDWTPTYRNLPNPEKQQLHSSLLAEQGFTCCYCGREIDTTDSHIEHFRPRSKYNDLELAYDNLLASCMRETRAGSPAICGHLKDEEFDESNFLSPLLQTVEGRFTYTFSGEVIPGDAAARRMVEVLGLNMPFLTSRRSEALRTVFDPEFLRNATQAELSLIAIEFRKFGEGGRASSFFHVVARVAEELLKVT